MEHSSKNLLLVSEIELVYKPKIKASERLKLCSSNEVYKTLLNSWDDNNIELYEQFKIILLNKNNKVLGIVPISRGGINATLVDLRLIFATACKANATNIILAHNHPSGNLQPSQQDIQLTKKIVAAGEILEIRVMDHLIITKEGFKSFSDEGWM